jgi:hypothetical protein
MLGFGVGAELLWGYGVEIALVVAVFHLALLHWYMRYAERKQRSVNRIASLTLKAYADAFDNGASDIAPWYQQTIARMTAEHKARYG